MADSSFQAPPMSSGESQSLEISRYEPEAPHIRSARFSLSNLSIRNRLTLLIGTLVFGMIAISIWASYRGVREAALEVGRERLLSLTQQLASLSQQSGVDLLNKTSVAANDAATVNFLRAPSPATRLAASAILQPFAPPRDPNSLQVELWKADHSVALVVPDSASPQAFDLEPEFKKCSVEPYRAVGEIRVLNDTITYTAITAVMDGTGQPMGYLVRWRRISPTPDARKRLGDGAWNA